MQERRLQIKTPYKSLFLTGLSGTEERDFVAQKSQLVGKSISAKVIKKLQMKVGSKELLISVAIKINEKAPVKLWTSWD